MWCKLDLPLFWNNLEPYTYLPCLDDIPFPECCSYCALSEKDDSLIPDEFTFFVEVFDDPNSQDFMEV